MRPEGTPRSRSRTSWRPSVRARRRRSGTSRRCGRRRMPQRRRNAWRGASWPAWSSVSRRWCASARPSRSDCCRRCTNCSGASTCRPRGSATSSARRVPRGSSRASGRSWRSASASVRRSRSSLQRGPSVSQQRVICLRHHRSHRAPERWSWNPRALRMWPVRRPQRRWWQRLWPRRRWCRRRTRPRRHRWMRMQSARPANARCASALRPSRAWPGRRRSLRSTPPSPGAASPSSRSACGRSGRTPRQPSTASGQITRGTWKRSSNAARRNEKP
mmetsp:Transcript_13071/g.41058  ORF Transcript_13071/g.41058 Transcript_13071/m.41058 type:complete len:274 (-) Transcript_13071:439-1260(-)